MSATAGKIIVPKVVVPEGINPEEMRPTYTPAQFAAEILLGVRTAEWVCDQIRVRKIRSLTPRPYTITRAEALRWLATH